MPLNEEELEKLRSQVRLSILEISFGHLKNAEEVRDMVIANPEIQKLSGQIYKMITGIMDEFGISKGSEK